MNRISNQPGKKNSLAEINDRIKQTFAEVTRYPIEILALESDLEEDLGIDSVKLGEVLAVIREYYQLPEDLQLDRDNLRNMKEIGRELFNYLEHVQAAIISPVANTQLGEVLPKNKTYIDDLLQSVQSIFAEVTRYPKEILDPQSNLEEDLGIDSVKLTEVFAVLRERYHLPTELQLPTRDLENIASIVAALNSYLKNQMNDVQNEKIIENFELNTKLTSCQEFDCLDKNGVSPISETAIEETIRLIFAEVTRYPIEVLDVHASLEEDLGIDSVKLGEVLSVLRETYKIPEDLDLAATDLLSISRIAKGLYDYLYSKEDQTAHWPEKGSVNNHDLNWMKSARNEALNKEDAGLNHLPETGQKPLAGKIAFISGSGRGLGKEIAMYLSQLGATVIINSFHSRDQGEATFQEINAKKGSGMHIWGSMANPGHVAEIFNQIEQEYGHLDFFISNASNGMLAKLEDLTVDHWEKAYRTNVIGLHQGALRAVSLMKKSGGGKIITLSSPAAHGYVDYFGCMGAVKAAVESLTRSMAIEFAPYNIQVNCVSPGPVYGSLLNKWPESKRLIAQWEDSTAYNRLCEAHDVAHFIAFLLNDSVKLFTGSVLVMDGGISSQGW